MNDDALADRARRAGIAVDWTDATGAPRRVASDTLRALLDSLGDSDEPEEIPTLATVVAGDRLQLPPGVTTGTTAAELIYDDGTSRTLTLRPRGPSLSGPPVTEIGYHRLGIAGREMVLAVAPPRCVTLAEAGEGKKMWGVAAQVPALRSADDGGIGHVGGIAQLARSAAARGADAVALSPVHALFAADATRFGPYAPSSRLFFNPLLADAALVLGEDRVAAHRTDTASLETLDLVDWPQAAAARFALLRRLFDDFGRHDRSVGTPLARDFQAFVTAGGADLRGHASFEALHARAVTATPPQGYWRDWPANAPPPAEEEVDYHLFLQWLADRSLAAAQKTATDAGMRIGLITDLAIGMDRGGSHAWSRRDDLLPGLSIGAPPDLFNTQGQNWGLAGFSPRALARAGYAPFLATLRAAMRHAGGVRIDHIMGLQRLWLVPDGASPAEGAYLSYPLGDLLRLLALESHRHRAVVIGEDLGTVPEGFRPRLRKAGVAGMDVLWFERTRTTFCAPSRWRDDAVAMTTTHDLPTVAGWWRGSDIETRAALGLAREDEAKERVRDRRRLWRACSGAGVAEGVAPPPEEPARAVDAALAFTASSPAPLMLAPLEDMLGVAEQPNLPGTKDQHPNWRRRFAGDAGQLLDDPAVANRAALISRHRARA